MTNPVRSSPVEATDMGPFILKRKQPDTSTFSIPVAPSRECFFIFVKVRIPGGTCLDSPFNGFFHF